MVSGSFDDLSQFCHQTYLISSLVALAKACGAWRGAQALAQGEAASVRRVPLSDIGQETAR